MKKKFDTSFLNDKPNDKFSKIGLRSSDFNFGNTDIVVGKFHPPAVIRGTWDRINIVNLDRHRKVVNYTKSYDIHISPSVIKTLSQLTCDYIKNQGMVKEVERKAGKDWEKQMLTGIVLDYARVAHWVDKYGYDDPELFEKYILKYKSVKHLIGSRRLIEILSASKAAFSLGSFGFFRPNIKLVGYNDLKNSFPFIKNSESYLTPHVDWNAINVMEAASKLLPIDFKEVMVKPDTHEQISVGDLLVVPTESALRKIKSGNIPQDTKSGVVRFNRDSSLGGTDITEYNVNFEEYNKLRTDEVHYYVLHSDGVTLSSCVLNVYLNTRLAKLGTVDQGQIEISDEDMLEFYATRTGVKFSDEYVYIMLLIHMGIKFQGPNINSNWKGDIGKLPPDGGSGPRPAQPNDGGGDLIQPTTNFRGNSPRQVVLTENAGGNEIVSHRLEISEEDSGTSTQPGTTPPGASMDRQTVQAGFELAKRIGNSNIAKEVIASNAATMIGTAAVNALAKKTGVNINKGNVTKIMKQANRFVN